MLSDDSYGKDAGRRRASVHADRVATSRCPPALATTMQDEAARKAGSDHEHGGNGNERCTQRTSYGPGRV
jgi:hypothetical protein